MVFFFQFDQNGKNFPKSKVLTPFQSCRKICVVSCEVFVLCRESWNRVAANSARALASRYPYLSPPWYTSSLHSLST